MPPKKFTRTQLYVTDIHGSDDNREAAALTAERTTPMLFPEAEIDDNDDFYDDLGGERHKDSLIDNHSGHLHSQITDQDHRGVATRNRLMLEMLLENLAQWKAEQRLEQERIAAEQERMAAEWDQWVGECAERTE
jgi:hypothetical protein